MTTRFVKFQIFIAIMILVSLASHSELAAQSTAFSYQGQIEAGGTPASGIYDLQAALFDAQSGGNQLGPLVTQSGVLVENGIFSVALDFGDVFEAPAIYLEVRVKQQSASSFTTLAPRQRLLVVPMAIRSQKAVSAETAQNSLALGGTNSDQFVLTTDSRLDDSRAPLPDSDFYIRNSDTQQAASFNVSGNGTAGGTLIGEVVRANSYFEITNQRFLGASQENTFAGISAGFFTSGTGNSFFGNGSGSNGSGNFNSFFGATAGNRNLGSGNSFFGEEAGTNNTNGALNSFFGRTAGFANITGNFNSFFGNASGFQNLGSNNSFFGTNSGRSNTTGSENSFFGLDSGRNNTTGTQNSAFGANSGRSATTGTGNSYVGYNSGSSTTSGSKNSFFGFSSGRANTIGFENSFFGSESGNANTLGQENSFFGNKSGFLNTTGSRNLFAGMGAGAGNTNGAENVFVGYNAGIANVSGPENTFVGVNSGGLNTTGNRNTALGGFAGPNSDGLSNATAIGYNAKVLASNQVQIGALNEDTVSIGLLGTGGTQIVCLAGNVLAACAPSAFAEIQKSMANIVGDTDQNTNQSPTTRNTSETIVGKLSKLSKRNEEQEAEIELLRSELLLLRKFLCAKLPDQEICKLPKQ